MLSAEERESKLVFIKRLIAGEAADCPACGKAVLTHFHKKAKKSNLDYICPSCGKRVKVLDLLDEINAE